MYTPNPFFKPPAPGWSIENPFSKHIQTSSPRPNGWSRPLTYDEKIMTAEDFKKKKKKYRSIDDPWDTQETQL